mgnify:FL=1
MSITFYCPDAPTEKVPCETCQLVEQYHEHDDEQIPWNSHGGCCSTYCDGTVMKSPAPEPNFANVNARNLIRLLKLPSDGLGGGDMMGGSCDAPTMLRAIMRVSNTDRTSALREPVEMAGGHAGTAVVTDDSGVSRIERMGAHCIDAGNTDEQTLRRLDDLTKLAQYASEHGLEISWG